jgi:AcrR family transcriptional regulator
MKTKAENPDKRIRILNAAKKLFNQTHDIKRVSIEAIAAEAGVSPTTIYNNYKDRETLIYEIIKDLSKTILERNKIIIDSDIPFAQKLIAIVSGKMDIAAQVNSEIIEKMISQDKKIAPFVDKMYEEDIKPLFIKILKEGKEQGYIDPGLDENAVLVYLDIIQAGLKAKQEIFRNFSTNMALMEHLTRLMFYGFMKKEIDIFQKGAK